MVCIVVAGRMVVGRGLALGVLALVLAVCDSVYGIRLLVCGRRSTGMDQLGCLMCVR